MNNIQIARDQLVAQTVALKLAQREVELRNKQVVKATNSNEIYKALKPN